MREYEYTIAGDIFRQGLRKSFRAQRNTMGLMEFHNILVREEGISTYEELPLTIPYSYLEAYGLPQNFPEPVIFRGRFYTLMLSEERLFMLDEQSWEPIELTGDIKGVYNESLSVTPNPGTIWQFCDMGQSWFLTNGKSIILYQLQNSMQGGIDNIRCSNSVWVEATCYHRGRMILGGMSNEKFWHTTWKTFLAGLGDDILTSMNTDISLKQNVVMWSHVGGDLFWAWFPTVGKQSHVSGAGYGDTRPFIFELLKRNDMGWIPMDWRGIVLQTVPMGESIIVYGDRDGGITRMSHVTDMQTYGKFNFSKLHGINNKGAAGGDDSVHLFLDPLGDLYLIDGEKSGPEKLGYREWFNKDLDTNWIVSYDDLEKLFYISNGIKTYVYTRYGLSTVGQKVSCIVHKAGVPTCLGTTLTDRDMIWTTDEVDQGRLEFDSLEWVKLGGRNVQQFKVSVYYTYTADGNEQIGQTDWFSLNAQGAAYIGITAQAFKISLKVDGDDISEIADVDAPDYVVYTIKNVDKRFTRGISIQRAQ